MYYLRYFAITLVFFFSFEKSLFCADRYKMPDNITDLFEKVLPRIAHQSGISTEQLREKNFELWKCIAQDLDTDFPDTGLLNLAVSSIFEKTCMIACKDLATLQRIAATTSFRSAVCISIFFDFEIERDEDGIISLTTGNRTFVLPAVVKYVV